MEGFAGKVAAVTGAGSGIGQALALELGRSGASLAISDVDAEGLAHTEEQLKAIGAPVRSDRLDVTEREAFQIYADHIKEHFGKVNQIYNNAGIAYTGDVEISQFKDIERVMDVDFWGVVNGTKAFLPHLVASGDGHVVNISSLFGLMSMPGPGRLQLRQIRRARLHRSAATGDGAQPRPGEGDVGAPGRHQDRDRPQRPDRRGGQRRRRSPPSSTSDWPAPPHAAPPRSSWTAFARTKRGCWSAKTPWCWIRSCGSPARTTSGCSPPSSDG